MPRRLSYAGAALAGAAAVAIVWWSLGGGAGGVGSLEHDPGIPPPDYVYLDNTRVLLYLGQIEGGLSDSEKRTQQLTQTRNAGVSASGLEAGVSVAQGASVEQVVTPTATARFYRLLDRLRAKGYLHAVDMSARPAVVAQGLGRVPEGAFVVLSSCRLYVPTYAHMAQLIRASHGRLTADAAYSAATTGTDPGAFALIEAEREAGRSRAATGPAAMQKAGGPQRLAAAARTYAASIPRNPRVPVSSCSGRPDVRARGEDLLLPLGLAALTGEQSLLAGPVTVVGKVVRQVRAERDAFVDEASLAVFEDAVRPLGAELARDTHDGDTLSGELDADVSVLSPGVVVLPLAIYK